MLYPTCPGVWRPGGAGAFALVILGRLRSGVPPRIWVLHGEQPLTPYRSYNLWIVRYLYVPLCRFHSAGRGSHDTEGAPSVSGASATIPFRAESPSYFIFFCAYFGATWWYRRACAVGGVFNILLMMGANLVGFDVCPDGTQYFVRAGIRSLFVARAYLFGVTWRNTTPMLT